MLGVVDDSDVRMGVGTAFLGYHGVSQAALMPLASKTLVDAHEVFTALSGLDLTPVASAISKAIEPVLDDAAERYGRLLAEEIHKRATAATERLLITWTSTGMPMPQAVEKAAEVHGVPLERLGRYAHQMKAVVQPLVRQDAADRVLMEYASELGASEATSGVSKSLSGEELAEFNEDHPRGKNGRFSDKATESSSPDARAARLARRNRLQALQAQRQEQTQLPESQSSALSLNALVSLFQRSAVQRESDQVRMRTQEQPQKDMRLDLNQVLQQKTLAIPADKPLPPARPRFFASKPEIVTALKEDLYVPVPKSLLESLSERNPVTIAEIAARIGRPVSGWSKDTLSTYMSPGEMYDQVFLRVRNPLVVDGGPEDAGGAVLADTAQLTGPSTAWTMQIDLPARDWRRSGSVDIQVVDLDIDNVDDVIRASFGKALDAEDVADFNEDHPRDARGRFTNTSDDPRAARLARLQRRNRMAVTHRDQRLPVLGARVKNESSVSLSDLLAAMQPPKKSGQQPPPRVNINEKARIQHDMRVNAAKYVNVVERINLLEQLNIPLEEAARKSDFNWSANRDRVRTYEKFYGLTPDGKLDFDNPSVEAKSRLAKIAEQKSLTLDRVMQQRCMVLTDDEIARRFLDTTIEDLMSPPRHRYGNITITSLQTDTYEGSQQRAFVEARTNSFIKHLPEIRKPVDAVVDEYDGKKLPAEWYPSDLEAYESGLDVADWISSQDGKDYEVITNPFHPDPKNPERVLWSWTLVNYKQVGAQNIFIFDNDEAEQAFKNGEFVEIEHEPIIDFAQYMDARDLKLEDIGPAANPLMNVFHVSVLKSDVFASRAPKSYRYNSSSDWPYA